MKAFATTKRGRPTRAAANDNREASAKDLGTPEAQLKRAALAQGADPVAAAHPLDLLLARGLIDASMHRAGFRYAGLYRRVIGRTEVSYGRLYERLSGDAGRRCDEVGRNEMGRDVTGRDEMGDEDDLAKAQLSFRQAQAGLRAEGPVVAGITERLAVFGAWPDWLTEAQPIARTQRELDLLRRGLQRLAAGSRRVRDISANDNTVSPRLP